MGETIISLGRILAPKPESMIIERCSPTDASFLPNAGSFFPPSTTPEQPVLGTAVPLDEGVVGRSFGSRRQPNWA
jgi:hypothetical protein